jgi:hypothetical protein
MDTESIDGRLTVLEADNAHLREKLAALEERGGRRVIPTPPKEEAPGFFNRPAFAISSHRAARKPPHFASFSGGDIGNSWTLRTLRPGTGT